MTNTNTTNTNASIPGTGPTTRKPGPTTALAAGTGGLSGAVVTIILWIATINGLEVPAEVGAALGVILTVAGAVIGGWLAPSTEARIKDGIAAHMSMVATQAEPVSILPDPEPASVDNPAAAVVEDDYTPAHAQTTGEQVEPDYSLDGPADLTTTRVD